MHVSQVRVRQRAAAGVGAHAKCMKGLCALLNSHQSEPQNRARLCVCACSCAFVFAWRLGGYAWVVKRVECDYGSVQRK